MGKKLTSTFHSLSHTSSRSMSQACAKSCTASPPKHRTRYIPGGITTITFFMSPAPTDPMHCHRSCPCASQQKRELVSCTSTKVRRDKDVMAAGDLFVSPATAADLSACDRGFRAIAVICIRHSMFTSTMTSGSTSKLSPFFTTRCVSVNQNLWFCERGGTRMKRTRLRLELNEMLLRAFLRELESLLIFMLDGYQKQ